MQNFLKIGTTRCIYIVILISTGIGFYKNMAAIKQHAIVEKRAGEGIFLSFSPYLCFGLNLRHMVMPDAE